MSLKKNFILILVLLVIALIVYGFGLRVVPKTPVSSEGTDQTVSTSIANPASTHCVQSLGGTLEIRDEAGGQVGYCHLKDGSVCEEWALFRDGSCASPK